MAKCYNVSLWEEGVAGTSAACEAVSLCFASKNGMSRVLGLVVDGPCGAGAAWLSVTIYHCGKMKWRTCG